MQLFQNRLDGFRHRQTEVCGILQKRYAFVGNVEEDDCGSKHTARTDDIHIQDVGNAYEQEDQHLAADTTETYFTGKCVVVDGTHDTCEVVDDYKSDQCVQETITAS